MAAELTILDANVLVAAVDVSRRQHAAALALLESDESVALTPQVIREFLEVATRPRDMNGLAMEAASAGANASAFAARTVMLAEDHRTILGLQRLIDRGFAVGKQIHDANIVATALVHGVRRIVSDDVRHFARFADLIEIAPLA